MGIVYLDIAKSADPANVLIISRSSGIIPFMRIIGDDGIEFTTLKFPYLRIPDNSGLNYFRCNAEGVRV